MEITMLALYLIPKYLFKLLFIQGSSTKKHSYTHLYLETAQYNHSLNCWKLHWSSWGKGPCSRAPQ